MEDLKILFWGSLAWTLLFFLWPLIETRSIKDAFWEWKVAMREWITHGIQGIIFLAIIGLIGFAIFR